MGQITITLNARSYKLRCGEGEENRLVVLADYVQTRLDKLREEFGQVGDERMLVMAALMITDELFDARDAMRNGEAPATVLAPTLSPIGPSTSEPTLSAEPAIEPESEADTAPPPAHSIELPVDVPMVEDPESGLTYEATLNRSPRRSEAPVSINERLAEARERALMGSSDAKA